MYGLVRFGWGCFRCQGWFDLARLGSHRLFVHELLLFLLFIEPLRCAGVPMFQGLLVGFLG
jgi:hypothetical protein